MVEKFCWRMLAVEEGKVGKARVVNREEETTHLLLPLPSTNHMKLRPVDSRNPFLRTSK